MIFLHGEDISLFWPITNNDVEEELKYLSLFKERQVDGVVFIATMFTRKHKQMLKDYKVPIVILGQHLDGYPCIYQDDHKAAFQVTGRSWRRREKVCLYRRYR